MTVGVEGANLESGFHNKWTYNKQQTGVDPTNIQHYFKTGLSATCEGLRLIPTLPLEDNGEPRNRENASEYLSYRIGKNTEYNFLTDVAKMKSNLNFRNGANLFDSDGYLNIFTHDVFKKDNLYYVLMRFNNAQVANEDYKVPPTLSSFIDDFYFKYTRVFGWADSFRVCRQINN